ncbi:ATP synthase F0 [Colletotrichum fioriniae PJ7]|uniref:ATP synthase F0 n=1 Tax=Colletotrichum fioriniae PJ7 TaxID=1445577 RepID=A0A010S6H2_9PEZI|nr:ATP synthase F0 [Colletotrichum fioriniae PJ7]
MLGHPYGYPHPISNPAGAGLYSSKAPQPVDRLDSSIHLATLKSLSALPLVPRDCGSQQVRPWRHSLDPWLVDSSSLQFPPYYLHIDLSQAGYLQYSIHYHRNFQPSRRGPDSFVPIFAIADSIVPSPSLLRLSTAAPPLQLHPHPNHRTTDRSEAKANPKSRDYLFLPFRRLRNARLAVASSPILPLCFGSPGPRHPTSATRRINPPVVILEKELVSLPTKTAEAVHCNPLSRPTPAHCHTPDGLSTKHGGDNLRRPLRRASRSWLPQSDDFHHYRIIARGTSEGISPWFVLLGVTSATAGFANILTVPPSRRDIACCSELGTFECAAGLLGIAQLGMQWISFALILVLFLIFFRYDNATVPEDELVDKPPSWHTAIMVGSVSLIHGLLVIILTVVFTTALREHLDLWANFLGVMAAALAAVQYIPQIWTTYHIKHVGSLSIPMMCIQTPGGFLFAGSLFARLGWEGWSTWGVFVLTASIQGVLLAMAIYYEFQEHHGEPQSPTLVDEPRRPNPTRTYSEGWEQGLPGPYTAHPERYADTEEELERLQDREERQVERETRPLLRPGGIGDPHKNYNATDD